MCSLESAGEIFRFPANIIRRESLISNIHDGFVEERKGKLLKIVYLAFISFEVVLTSMKHYYYYHYRDVARMMCSNSIPQNKTVHFTTIKRYDVHVLVLVLKI